MRYCFYFPNTTVNTQKTSKTQPRTSTTIEEPTTVSNVFRENFSQLVRSVGQQPDMIMMITVELYSKGLISEYVKNDITTTTGVSSSQKSVTLVNELETQINVDPRLIKELCKVMQQWPTLAHVAKSISEALGELMNVGV